MRKCKPYATNETRAAIIRTLASWGGSGYLPCETREARMALSELIAEGVIRVTWQDGRIVHALCTTPNGDTE